MIELVVCDVVACKQIFKKIYIEGHVIWSPEQIHNLVQSLEALTLFSQCARGLHHHVDEQSMNEYSIYAFRRESFDMFV